MSKDHQLHRIRTLRMPALWHFATYPLGRGCIEMKLRLQLPLSDNFYRRRNHTAAGGHRYIVSVSSLVQQSMYLQDKACRYPLLNQKKNRMHKVSKCPIQTAVCRSLQDRESSEKHPDGANLSFHSQAMVTDPLDNPPVIQEVPELNWCVSNPT